MLLEAKHCCSTRAVFCADCQLMLLLVISQQPWHELCSNLPHVEFVWQNALARPIRQCHSVANIVDCSPTFLADTATQFCNIFCCCANWSWTRTFIIVNWHVAILCWLNKLQVCMWPKACIAKCLLKHFVSVCSTLAKFEAKRDVNTQPAPLLPPFRWKKLQKTQTRCYKNVQIRSFRELSTKPHHTLVHKGYMQHH